MGSLSFAGVGSAGLSTVVVHGIPLLATGIVLLAWSMYTNVRRGGWWLNKFLTLVKGRSHSRSQRDGSSDVQTPHLHHDAWRRLRDSGSCVRADDVKRLRKSVPARLAG